MAGSASFEFRTPQLKMGGMNRFGTLWTNGSDRGPTRLLRALDRLVGYRLDPSPRLGALLSPNESIRLRHWNDNQDRPSSWSACIMGVHRQPRLTASSLLLVWKRGRREEIRRGAKRLDGAPKLRPSPLCAPDVCHSDPVPLPPVHPREPFVL